MYPFMIQSTVGKAQVTTILLALVAITGAIISVGLPSDTPSQGGADVLVRNSPDGKNKSDQLQLKSLDLITVAPTVPVPTAPSQKTGGSCNHDNGIPIVNTGKSFDPNAPDACNCIATIVNCIGPGLSDPPGNPMTVFCGGNLAPEPGTYCIGKPIIYLYPTKSTLVDVKIRTIGKIVISDPLYPPNGWKNVLAHPNGTLHYKGKTYKELYYESEVADFKKPETGISIKTSELETDLGRYITQLGLIKNEKKDFLEYWVPKLKELNKPYIFFSIIDPQEKERIDQVIIKPEPDTRIEFIAYFKPLQRPYVGEKLQLPLSPPQRIGFTEVEWGGTIEK